MARSERRRPLVQAIVLLMLAAAPAAGQVAGGQPVTIDRIMAVVDTQPIMLSDVDAALTLGLGTPPAGGDRLAAGLTMLVDRTLMLEDVDRYQPPEPAAAAIDARMAAVERRAGSAAALDRELAAVGLTRAQLTRRVRDDLRIQEYLDSRFAGGPQPISSLVADWVAGLRRRADITVLYRAAGQPGG
ncbi:MAG TPA: hypothetical protein VFX12_03500 [Vicinamibacterales bacterium]|nr:hypothetical protein [Vicinamibacterales bacterium]